MRYAIGAPPHRISGCQHNVMSPESNTVWLVDWAAVMNGKFSIPGKLEPKILAHGVAHTLGSQHQAGPRHGARSLELKEFQVETDP